MDPEISFSCNYYMSQNAILCLSFLFSHLKRQERSLFVVCTEYVVGCTWPMGCSLPTLAQGVREDFPEGGMFVLRSEISVG